MDFPLTSEQFNETIKAFSETQKPGMTFVIDDKLRGFRILLPLKGLDNRPFEYR